MQIKEFYRKVRIPPNLERHMFQVTTVAEAIVGHWQGPKLNSSLLRKSLLVHDVGNLVKFRRPFLGELEINASYWESVQKEMITLYGSDAHEATLHILQEYEVDSEIYQFIQTLTDRQLILSPFVDASWEILIAELADLSVSPEGVVGVESRVKDIQVRYASTFHEEVWHYAMDLQEKIQQFAQNDLKNLHLVNLEIPERAYLEETLR